MSDTQTLRSHLSAPGISAFGLSGPKEEGRYLVSASLPVWFVREEDLPRLEAVSGEQHQAVQHRVLSRDEDGSPRRLLLRFPWDFEADQAVNWQAVFADAQPEESQGILSEVTPHLFEMRAGTRRLSMLGNYITILREEALECGVQFLGPDFPTRFMGPEITVIENGPYFAWVAAEYFGGAWNVRIEIQADRLGEVELIGRLSRMRGETRMPRFGFRTVAGAATGHSGDREMELGRTVFADLAGAEFSLVAGDRATRFFLPRGAQSAQGRLVLSEENGQTRVELFRSAELDPGGPVRFLEGQERTFHLVLPGEGGGAHGSSRVWAQADRRQRQRDSEDGLVDWGELAPLRERATRAVLKMQCLEGDDFGAVGQTSNAASPRFEKTVAGDPDCGFGILRDYERGGDDGIREWFLRWAEDYVSLRIYRGWDLNAYGGERALTGRAQEFPSSQQGGSSLLVRAYEEYGDPRYLEAALDSMDRVVKRLEHSYFMTDYVLRGAWGLDVDVRSASFCCDLVDFYNYTGEERYLEAALRLLKGLTKLRVGEALWKENYPDPFSPLDLPVTGEDIWVGSLTRNCESPEVLEAILRGALEVHAAAEDELARKMAVDICDFLVESQNEAGLWNSPQAGSPAGSISRVGAQIARSLLRAYGLIGEPSYFQCAERALRLLVQLFEHYGTLPEGIPPQKNFSYAGDFTSVDFRRLALDTGRIARRAVSGFLEAMNLYFQLAFDPGPSLVQPLTKPLAKYLVEEARVVRAEGTRAEAFAARVNSIETDYEQCLEAERSGSIEESIARWRGFIEKYPEAPMEHFRLVGQARKLGDPAAELESIDEFTRSFPSHPRCGRLLLRKARILESMGEQARAVQVFRQVVEDFFGSVWERDASVHLFRLGEEAQPEGLLVAHSSDEMQPELFKQEHFIQASTGLQSAQSARLCAIHGDGSLTLSVQGERRAFSGKERLRLYLDLHHDYESWRCYEIDTEGGARTWCGSAFGDADAGDGPNWTGTMGGPEKSWTARLSLEANEEMPLVEGDILGLNLVRESNLGRSLWQPMVSQPVTPHAFGRLLLA